ncbi:MAG: RDD family protein [Flammeovirgaceae bacterium]
MTDQQLKYCRICSNKAFDPQTGMYCALTGAKPNFVDLCPTFKPVAEADLQQLDLKVTADSLAHASAGNRFVNMLIDTIMYYIIVFVLAIMMAVFVGLVAPGSLDEMDNEPGTPWYMYLVAITGFVSYYVFCESVFGRTVGKLITGTKVVDQNGQLPSTGTIFLRTLARMVPFEAFSFLGDDARGWHDRWTNTYVVKK